MINIPSLSELSVSVFGLGRSGLSSALALQNSGAIVSVWDDNEVSRLHAMEVGLELVDLYEADWSNFSILVLSPGVALNYPEPHAIVQLARENGIEVIGDMELLARSNLQARVIGITGTNGKSTTTALIGHLLFNLGQNVQVGGNLGIPVLDFEPMEAAGNYVLEMSSYQLDLTHSLVFDVALLLNLSNDHLDRHGGMDGYISSKKRIFAKQDNRHTAIVGVDDVSSKAIYEELKKNNLKSIIGISGEKAVSGGVYVHSGVLYDHTEEGPAVAVINLAQVPSLPGVHNAQNVAAAYAAGRTCGLEREAIVSSLASFRGLAHRQELLAVIDGISYVNDSKATNGESAARALSCYSNIYWIAGGRAKDGGMEAASPYLDRVRHVYLIGEAAIDLAQNLESEIPVTVSGELSSAVDQARANALADSGDGAVVLLSPACASLDQFDNFETRGEAFRELVDALPGKRMEAVT
jgi:UDP-N-acetylmuramoylalanine--D-glutamate ligase